MPFTDEEKLQNLAAEAMNDAAKICEEIKENVKTEFQEKLEAGEKKLLSDIYNYIQTEIEKIRREKSLEISQANIKSRQEYFKYSHTISQRVFEQINLRLKDFLSSEDYEKYLIDSCKNIIQKSGSENEDEAEIDILYMPRDEELINKIKSKIKFGEKTQFKKDEFIDVGGLRFFNRKKNILINDIFDEKMERAKELLSSLIGPQFTAI